MSAALATNKVVGANENLMDIYPKYLFQAKSCSTKIQDFLPKNKDKQQEGNKKDKKHENEASLANKLNQVIHGVTTIL